MDDFVENEAVVTVWSLNFWQVIPLQFLKISVNYYVMWFTLSKRLFFLDYTHVALQFPLMQRIITLQQDDDIGNKTGCKYVNT